MNEERLDEMKNWKQELFRTKVLNFQHAEVSLTMRVLNLEAPTN